MNIANKYTIYVGTIRGTLQYTCCKPDEKGQFSLPEEQSEVTALEWGLCDDEIIVGYKNGHVNLYNTIENKYVKSLNKLEGDGSITGLGVTDKSIVIAKREGIISIWNSTSSDYFSVDLEEKATLDCMVYHKNRPNIVATGGEFNDFKLWDVDTKQCIFKAKSLGHDELNLPIATSIRGITFLPESEKLSACATKEGYVLLYDERAQRKPVVKFLEKKASYTCISSAFRDKQCLVGTTKGYMQLLDLKTPGRNLKTFTAFTGSVTSIVCDPLEPLVASTSLDRYLRVHNLETKELVYKVYLKQSLMKILWKPLIKEEEENEEVQVVDREVDKEYEELFNNMETVEEASEKKKKRKVESENVKKKKKKVKSV